MIAERISLDRTAAIAVSALLSLEKFDALRVRLEQETLGPFRLEASLRLDELWGLAPGLDQQFAEFAGMGRYFA